MLLQLFENKIASLRTKKLRLIRHIKIEPVVKFLIKLLYGKGNLMMCGPMGGAARQLEIEAIGAHE